MEDNPIANSMSAVVDHTTFSDPSADSRSGYQDDKIGDLSSHPVGSLHLTKKIKTEEEKTEGEKMEVDVEEKKKKVYYSATGCRFCKELATREFKAMPDDDDYGCGYLNDDPELKLRVINYLRSKYESGGFDIECLPDGFFGGIYNRDHFFPYFEDAVEASGPACIEDYNAKKTKKLEFKKTINATGTLAKNIVLYLTFEAMDPEKEGDDKTETYQAVLSYSILESSVRKIFIFRRKSDGEDLLDADPYYAKKTRPASWFDGVDSEEEEEDSE